MGIVDWNVTNHCHKLCDIQLTSGILVHIGMILGVTNGAESSMTIMISIVFN